MHYLTNREKLIIHRNNRQNWFKTTSLLNPWKRVNFPQFMKVRMIPMYCMYSLSLSQTHPQQRLSQFILSPQYHVFCIHSKLSIHIKTALSVIFRPHHTLWLTFFFSWCKNIFVLIVYQLTLLDFVELYFTLLVTSNKHPVTVVITVPMATRR